MPTIRSKRSRQLRKSDITHLRKLLKAKTSESISLTGTLLASLGATREDYKALFTPRVISVIVRTASIDETAVQRWEALLSILERCPELLKAFDDNAARTVRSRKSGLDLDTLPALSARVAKALAARQCPWHATLSLGGLTVLDVSVAKALSRFSGTLLLNGLETLEPDVAAALATHKGGSLELDGLRELSDSAAQALARHRGSGLSLDGLDTLSPASAAAISRYKGNYLSLNGITVMADKASRALQTPHAGWLVLNGLQSISTALAEALGKSRRFLRFNGVASLSLAAAMALAKHDGVMELGVKALDDDVASALAQYKGRSLDLYKLESASSTALTALQSNRAVGLPDRFLEPRTQPTRRHENRGPTNADASALTEEAARELLTRVGVLTLPNLVAISDSVAEILSQHKGGSLVLPGLATLSEAAAEWLSRHKGPVRLNGLTTLSDAAASHLANLKGSLHLDSLVSLSAQAAQHLSTHSGPLSLRGLHSLGDRAAAGLCGHKGFIDLRTLPTLSTAAAASLSTHTGGLNLKGLSTLPDAAAEHLCTQRFTTTDRLGKHLRVSHAVAAQLKAARVRLRRHGA